MTSPALSVRQASLVYPSSQVPVLNDASIELQAGEIACLLGASGCGKTTLLRCIAGFDKPNTGSIYLGDEIAFDEDNFLAVECRHVGMIFQDYALFPHLSVQQNIGFGLKNSTIEKTEHAAVIRDTLELLGLTEQA
ncbi:MAG: ATP-binding cassette domain-containing protein, partial [Sinobacterium sp.]|nr:ATP-binding cassette domain-containing protein [Sinobacterium sp.]